MKKNIKYFFSTISLFLISVVVTFADSPTPPNPVDPGTGGGTPVGAPIDNGVMVLLALGVIYGAMKLFHNTLHKRALSKKETGSAS